MFTVNGNGTAFNTVTDFKIDIPGSYPQYVSLVLAPNGKLYGTTVGGGAYGYGTLFSFDPVTQQYEDVFDFDLETFYGFPECGLILANDGLLYGAAGGTFFSVDPTTNVCTVLTWVSGNISGKLAQGSDGNLYGLTSTAPVYPSEVWGSLFSYNPITQEVIDIQDFYGNESFHGPPMGGVISASDGNIYGVTSQYGGDDIGFLFSYHPPDIPQYGYIELFDFQLMTGGMPSTGTLLEATNGKLYGMNYGGGGNQYFNGGIFSYDPVGGTYTDEYDFIDSTGSAPMGGSLIQSPTGKMYGMTSEGGAHNMGVIFSFDPVSQHYTDIHDFNTIDGADPLGSLFLLGGKLYGMTYYGGMTNVGVFFSIDTDANNFTKIFEFNQSKAAKPYGTLCAAANGKFYGTTSVGGDNNAGTVFSYDPVTGNNAVAVQFSLNTGANPQFGQLVQTADSKLYGMAVNGGAHDSGVIFSFDPATNDYHDVHDFNGINGSSPMGGLTLSNNGIFYGLTQFGGTFNHGVIFSYNPVNNNYTKLFDFDDTTGQSPNGKLLQVNGTFYGMTKNGGTAGRGVIFSYDSVNGYKTLFNFDPADSTGTYPYGSFVLGNEGLLYGMTYAGGTKQSGTIFSFDAVSRGYTELYSFDNGGNGGLPYGDLLLASDSNFYGMTNNGGNKGLGTIFKFNVSSNTLTVLQQLDTLNTGGAPFGNLIEYGCYTAPTTISASICTSSSYTFKGQQLTSSGTYMDTLASAHGCDSIVTLHLQVSDVIYTNLDDTICAGQSISFNNQVLTSSGIYFDSLTAQGGCDSIIMLTVVVNSLPQLSILGDTLYCNSGALNLQVNGALNYYWYNADTSFSSVSNVVSVSPAQSGYYFVRGIDSTGCSSLESISVSVMPLAVWPGDANNDSVVNNFDVLALGIAYGATGPARPEASIIWGPQCALAWAGNFTNGNNYAFADCNGDGIIDENDTMAIQANYGQTKNMNSVFREGSIPLTITTQYSSYNSGDTVKGYISLGDTNSQANDVYGIAYTFNPGGITALNSLSVQQSESWLTPANNQLLFTRNSGSSANVAQTRINHSNTSGQGAIMIFSFVIDTNLSGNVQRALSVENVLCINNSGDTMGLNIIPETIAIHGQLNNIDEVEEAQIKVFPNPTKNILTVQLSSIYKGANYAQLIDEFGQIVLSKKFSSEVVSFDLSEFSSGIFLLKVYQGNNEMPAIKKICLIK